jgi:uncharacterized membrane protein YeaQ/YmgE (transglycosylase-associated protein family)
MAVLGWITLGLATAVMRSSFRRGDERRDGLAASCAIAVVGALLAGLVAVAAGVGSIGDFFHTGTWLIAFAGAVLALVASELPRSARGCREITGPRSRPWAGTPAGKASGFTGTGEELLPGELTVSEHTTRRTNATVRTQAE